MFHVHLGNSVWNSFACVEQLRNTVYKYVLKTLCANLSTNPLTTMVHHLQTHRDAKPFNKTTTVRLRYYAGDRQRALDVYMQKLTFKYEDQVHRSTSLAPSSPVLSPHPPRPIEFDSTTVLLTDTKATTSRHGLLARILELMMTMPQDRDKQNSTSADTIQGRLQ